MFSIIPVKASKILTRLTLTCGTGISGNGASRIILSRSILGVYHLLLHLFEIRLRLLQCFQRPLSRFDSPTKPGPHLVHLLTQGLSVFHRRLLLLHLAFQDILRATPPPLPVPAAAEQGRGLALSLSWPGVQPIQGSFRHRSGAAKARSDPFASLSPFYVSDRRSC